VPQDAVALVSLSIVVELPNDYVVIAARRNQPVVRTEGQCIDTLFGVVVQLMNTFPCSPAPNPDVPIVSSCSQHDIKVSACTVAPANGVEVSV